MLRFTLEMKIVIRLFSSPSRILNNADWWSKVTATEFVSNIARHFRLSAMLAKERSVGLC